MTALGLELTLLRMAEKLTRLEMEAEMSAANTDDLEERALCGRRAQCAREGLVAAMRALDELRTQPAKEKTDAQPVE